MRAVTPPPLLVFAWDADSDTNKHSPPLLVFPSISEQIDFLQQRRYFAILSEEALYANGAQ
jgi:hypothetical protein